MEQTETELLAEALKHLEALLMPINPMQVVSFIEENSEECMWCWDNPHDKACTYIVAFDFLKVQKQNVEGAPAATGPRQVEVRSAMEPAEQPSTQPLKGHAS